MLEHKHNNDENVYTIFWPKSHSPSSSIEQKMDSGYTIRSNQPVSHPLSSSIIIVKSRPYFEISFFFIYSPMNLLFVCVYASGRKYFVFVFLLLSLVPCLCFECLFVFFIHSFIHFLLLFQMEWVCIYFTFVFVVVLLKSFYGL